MTAPPPSRRSYSQDQVDEIVHNRLEEQSEQLWVGKVNTGMEELRTQHKALVESGKDIADTIHDIHAVLKNLLDWQGQQMMLARDFQLDQITQKQRKSLLHLLRAWRWAVVVWGVVLIVAAPLVSALIAKALGLKIP